MEFNLGNHVELNQKLVMTPQLQQSLEILQMSQQELAGFIEQQSLENPVMEIEENYEDLEPYEKLMRKMEWIEETDTENRIYYKEMEEDKEDYSFFPVAGDEESFTESLMSQVEFLSLEKSQLQAVKYIIHSLNENGYLEISLEDLAGQLHMPVSQAEETLKIVQSFEPFGVGARDLKECLLIQLKNRGIEDQNLVLIIEKYLDELGKNRLDYIAKQLGISIETVKKLHSIIKTLTPYPGAAFSPSYQARFIKPDVVVVKFKDYFEVMLNDVSYPKIGINSYYKNLMESSGDMEAKEYISRKIQQVSWVIKAIEQRNNTLLNISKQVVEVQQQFFSKGPKYLVPMVMKDIAERLNVHESTVSRAIHDKYIHCPWGLYKLKYFFSSGVGSDKQTGTAPGTIKALLRETIDSEDKAKPFSDQKIADILAQKGCAVARRTVAKYREELNIPGAQARKKF